MKKKLISTTTNNNEEEKKHYTIIIIIVGSMAQYVVCIYYFYREDSFQLTLAGLARLPMVAIDQNYKTVLENTENIISERELIIL